MSVITRESEQLVISGKTFDIKDIIKEIGGRWDAARRVWTLPYTEEARAKLLAASAAAEDRLKAEKKEKKRKAAYRLTPEGQAEARAEAREVVKRCLVEKAKTGQYFWICCEECEVIDWQRQHTSCRACAHWDGQSWNSFFVRGGLYTGT